MSELNQEKLKELFNYRDGVLYWKIIKPGIKFDSIAGCLCSDGYHRIGINRKLYKRSRLIFCYHNGYFPENDVDHRNRIKNDDLIENLREVSRQCNARNCGNRKDNTSGIKGVYWYKKLQKWQVQIMVNQKFHHLGYYKNFDNAVCARLAAEQCLNWSGCDSNSPAYQYVQKMLKDKT